MIKEDDPDHVALMCALERREFDLASEILARDRQNKYIHPVGLMKVTALHVAAWQGTIDLLDQLYKKGAVVNAADKIGRCALYYAAHRGNVDVTRWILERGGDVHAKVYIPRRFRFTGIIASTCVNTCGSCKGFDDHSTMVKSSFVGETLPLPTCWERTPLHEAVKNNHVDVVRLLVEAGADVNVKDERLVSPLLLAGSTVNLDNVQEMANFNEIIRILLSKKAFVNSIHPDTGTTALHHSAMLGSVEATELLLANDAWPMFKCKSAGSTPLHIAANVGSAETLAALLKATQPHHINSCDQLNRTALHLASYQGHSDCVRILIKQGGNLAATTKTGVTVIDAIFAHIPQPLAFLTDILDSCVRTTNNCSLEKCDTITVDFDILAPKYQMQMGVITAVIAATSSITRLGILRHPLVETFLRLKWVKLRLYFFLFVLLHIVFVISLSSYALMLIGNMCIYQIHRIFLIVCAVIFLVHTTIQVLLEPRYYLRQYEMWLSFACSILSLVTSIADNQLEDCKEETNLTQELLASTTRMPMTRMTTMQILTTQTQMSTQEMPTQGIQVKIDDCWLLHCMSITILLCWIQMMLLIGRFPMWGYYALMFSTVLKNMLKVLLAFGYLIVGFALSFAVLFHGNDKFHDWKVLITTVVMMMGEYEYDNLFKKDTYLSWTSRFVFLIFILFSIVLINLMTGLAVNDIQAIEKEGHIRRLLKQAEFIIHLERVRSHRIFRSWLCRRYKIHSSRDIPTKITLSYRENYSHRVGHIDAPRDIPFELKETLFLLASKTCSKNYSSSEDRIEDADAKFNLLLSNLEQHLRKYKSPAYINLPSQELSKRRGIKRKCATKNL